jgi:hypothetical protein
MSNVQFQQPIYKSCSGRPEIDAAVFIASKLWFVQAINEK